MAEGEGIQAGSQGADAGQTGSAVPDWGTLKGSLGELGNDKSFEPIKDFPGLAKSFVDAQKMIGSSIRLPGKDLKLEDRQKAVNEILGKLRGAEILESPPESWEKYEVKMPQEEGFQVNQPLYDSFRQAAHKFGLPPSQAQGLFDWYLNFQAESNQQESQKFDEMKLNLKKEWGGLYTRRMESARRAVGQYLGEDGDDILSGLPPEVGIKLVRAFAVIGEPLLEDALIEGEKLGVANAEETQKKINAIINDPKHPLWDVSHANHKAAVEEWTGLQKMLIQLKPNK